MCTPESEVLNELILHREFQQCGGWLGSSKLACLSKKYTVMLLYLKPQIATFWIKTKPTTLTPVQTQYMSLYIIVPHISI